MVLPRSWRSYVLEVKHGLSAKTALRLSAASLLLGVVASCARDEQPAAMLPTATSSVSVASVTPSTGQSSSEATQPSATSSATAQPALSTTSTTGPAVTAGEVSTASASAVPTGDPMPGETSTAQSDATAAPTSSDASPPDAGEAPPSTGCDNAAFLLCEDFETTEPGAIPAAWHAEGDVEVVEDGHSGQRALRSNPEPNWVRRVGHDASTLPPEHWGRIFYRVKLPVTNAFVHSTFVALTGVGPTSGSAEYRVVDTVKSETDAQGNHTHQFLWNVQPEAGSEFGLGSDYTFEFDGAWHCAEWFVSGTNQAYRFFHDGQPVAPLDFANGPGNYGTGQTKSDIPNAWESVWIGFTNYQTADPGFTSWVDDFAIASERIGCE